LENLDLPWLDLRHLCDRFTEAEVWNAIKALPPNKAPRPDGFSTRFLQAAWPIVRPDLMKALDAFWQHDMRNLHDVNGALMVLLPKSSDATNLKQFRPISLIHSVGKLISKLLANMLAPRLSELVHPSQSAFIKQRFIQDSYKYVQSVAKLLHVRRHPSLLLKVDIARAFDSMAWSFLIEVLQHLGFPRLWIDWVAALLSTANTKVMLNGVPGERICHARGLCQGDPLSPILFY
jgi:hypothetical protein